MEELFIMKQFHLPQHIRFAHEDSEKNIEKFRNQGGFVHQYVNDELFLKWKEKHNL